MSILVTGAAGFIGSHLCRRLLERGDEVVGVDSLNDYYDPALKKARLSTLADKTNFSFLQVDIAEQGALEAALAGRKVSRIVHLAAQAGIRYSLQNPRAYIHSNILGHLEVLEFCRARQDVEHLVYASSSSIYGGNRSVPFHEDDRVDNPVSLYAATKKSDELMSHTYSHLFGLAQTGVRFFTAYGPWGRPDMAYWLFADALTAGKPIRLFNHGNMWRDFTYINDVVTALEKILDKPPADRPPHRIYNVGNNIPVKVSRLVDILESLLKTKAVLLYEDMQAGEVETTCADITALERDFGFKPQTPLETGLEAFVGWYRDTWRALPRVRRKSA